MTEFEQTNASAMGLEDESLVWVNRLLSGAVTRDEAEAFKTWRSTSPAHEAAFAEAVRFRRAMRRAILAERRDAPATPLTQDAASLSGQRSTRPVSRRAVMGGAIAASAVAYLAARPPTGLWPSWSELTSDYRTGTGQRREIAAASGVSMELNTQTSIARHAEHGAPGIELVSGEAAISASRPPGAPFAVLAGSGRTLLADGAVNIRNVGATVCVTCLSGNADVLHPTGRVRLQGGAQVTYTADALAPVQGADVALATAWRKGLLIFRDTPLQQVVDELNRYRPGRIVLVDAALARRPVYGVFQIHEIERAVDQVRHLTGARATQLPGGLVLLS